MHREEPKPKFTMDEYERFAQEVIDTERLGAFVVTASDNRDAFRVEISLIPKSQPPSLPTPVPVAMCDYADSQDQVKARVVETLTGKHQPILD